MREWHYSEHDIPVQLNFQGDFDEQVKKLKSREDGHFHMGGHNYHILKALFEGNVIDDYENPPYNAKGLAVRNVRSRIADLRIDWNICIGDRQKEGKPYKEYMIHGRGA